MHRGDTPTFEIDIVDFNGDALDITGASAYFTAKTGYNDSDENAVFQKTIGNGITVTDALLGKMAIVLDSEDTNGLLDRVNLRYDLQVIDISGGVYTVASGLLVVDPDVTRGIA